MLVTAGEVDCIPEITKKSDRTKSPDRLFYKFVGQAQSSSNVNSTRGVAQETFHGK